MKAYHTNRTNGKMEKKQEKVLLIFCFNFCIYWILTRNNKTFVIKHTIQKEQFLFVISNRMTNTE